MFLSNSPRFHVGGEGNRLFVDMWLSMLSAFSLGGGYANLRQNEVA